MPLYEFECSKCKAHFEQIQKFSDPDPTIFPDGVKHTKKACKGTPVKILSRNSFQLKGEGWYVTDYKDK